MSADEIVWADPPPPNKRGRKSGRTRDFVDALKANPGVWAVYPAKGGATGTALRRYGCEVTTRRDEPGKSSVTIYARWPGDA